MLQPRPLQMTKIILLLLANVISFFFFCLLPLSSFFHYLSLIKWILNTFYQPRLIGNTYLYIHFCKTEKNVPICTIHCSFQLKSTLEAVKLTTFIPFHTKYDLQEQFWLFSHSYLQNGMLWLLNNFNILHDLKTESFECFVTYTALYVWVY